ncbi:hypothetical protein [Dongshaea marina]|uniref:hypothetical protein n=1 Tax=Dongshaea marina TaxID=2047966 RepID=UPI000D3E2ADD|nr:hypothetical protein [Dongshaea marina]
MGNSNQNIDANIKEEYRPERVLSSLYLYRLFAEGYGAALRAGVVKKKHVSINKVFTLLPCPSSLKNQLSVFDSQELLIFCIKCAQYVTPLTLLDFKAFHRLLF